MPSRSTTSRLTLPGAMLVAFAATQQVHGQQARGQQPAPSAKAADDSGRGADGTRGSDSARGAGRAEPQWPRILGEPKGSPNEWSKDEIETARVQCNALLAGLGAVAVPADPVRSGECGAPAPMELISIGTAPQVTFSPPAVVTCEMIAALDKWFKTDVQPAAKSLLGARVVRVEVMSSYSCRTAYNRRHARLSEHGRANAIDVKSFLTERGDTVDVQTDWGLTERDIKARIAAAKKEAERQEAARLEAERQEAARKEAERIAAAKAKARQAREAAPEADQPGVRPFGEVLRGSIADERGPALQLPPVLGGRKEPGALGWTPPSQLGGPKETATPSHTADPSKPKERFLRRIHGSACQIFGTILGPEANDAHRNHFHIDMAERRSGSYCE